MPISTETQPTRDFSFTPFAWLSASFASGILLGKFLGFDWQIWAATTILALLVSIFFLLRNNLKLATIFVLFAFIGSGALVFAVENLSVKPNRIRQIYDSKEIASGEPVEIEGVLQGKPELLVGGVFLFLRTEKLGFKNQGHDVSGNVRLFLPETDDQSSQIENLDLKFGTRIRAFVSLRREESFQNPGVSSRKEILDQQGIDAIGTLKSSLLIERLGDERVFLPFAWLSERKQDLILQFRQNFSISTSGVLIASLLGNKYHLTKDVAERFRQGGTFHVLVISGLHITFIGTWLAWLMRRFTKKRWLEFIISNSILWAYSIMVGAEVPVTRAAIMFTILHFAVLVNRNGNLLNSLGASALVLLIWRPNDLFSQSFQLTFICVVSIIALAFPLLEKLRAIGKWQISSETPVPPSCANWVKSFCEILFWSEKNWKREQKRNIWQTRIFKNEAAEMLERRGLQSFFRYVFETLSVSLIVQTFLIPLMVVYFHRISVVAILLNVWVGALMAILSLTAILALIVAPISHVLATPLIWLTEGFTWLVIHVGDSFFEKGLANLRLPHYAGNGIIIYFLYFVPIVFLAFAVYKWNPFELKKPEQNNNAFFGFVKNHLIHFALISMAILLAVIVFHPFSSPVVDGKLRVEFLDVGQGDSALLTMPNGETLLIDGGGKINFNAKTFEREGEEPEFFEPDTQSIGEAVVSEFLWEKGIDSVDYLLPTHADADHIDGLNDIARNFSVKAAISPRTPANDPEFQKFAETLHKRSIPIIKPGRGDVLNFGDARIEILNPEKNDSNDAPFGNNQGLVLRVVYGKTSILMMADVEKETEAELLKSPELLQCDVVKVAHHGSRTSSTEKFIEATKAKFAIISVGLVSQFGHPHEEIVERWKKSNANVLTTGENGTISVVSDGNDVAVNTFLPTKPR